MILSFTPLNAKHLDAVIKIEKEGIPPFWGKNDFRKSCKIDNLHAYVLEIGPDYHVVGFVTIEASNKRINITNIGVAKSERRRGYGRTMIAGIRARFPNCSLYTMSYENNLDFQLFLKACGFLCTSIIHGDHDSYLFMMPEDAIG